MKKTVLSLLVIGALCMMMPLGVFAQEYNFGDYRSVTLATKGWQALDKGDIEAVLAYTNKCIELYSKEAKKMQGGLTEYVKSAAEGGSDQDVFSLWALNDVGTCYFIQGEAFRKASMFEEAKEAYTTLVNGYAFAQCWDSKGWFWKPAEAAKEKLEMFVSGKDYDFGDYTSQTLTTKAWGAFNAGDLNMALMYTDKCIELYQDKAKEMQASLDGYPWESNEEVFSYWALNDVGTCFFIKGDMLRQAGKIQEAKEAFNTLMDEFKYAQSWDPNGWFWKPADAARERLLEIEDVASTEAVDQALEKAEGEVEAAE
ncbi:hypothetical protein ACFL1E_01775 [Candidatus Omnitrophota bacterium]